jgi:hypothetical protein
MLAQSLSIYIDRLAVPHYRSYFHAVFGGGDSPSDVIFALIFSAKNKEK